MTVAQPAMPSPGPSYLRELDLRPGDSRRVGMTAPQTITDGWWVSLLWCEQNVDLGAKLPLLAVYLGHTGLASSQRYLQLTQDLMGEITRRHQDRFGYLINEGRV